MKIICFILNKTKLIDIMLYFNALIEINTYVSPVEYSEYSNMKNILSVTSLSS